LETFGLGLRTTQYTPRVFCGGPYPCILSSLSIGPLRACSLIAFLLDLPEVVFFLFLVFALPSPLHLVPLSMFGWFSSFFFLDICLSQPREPVADVCDSLLLLGHQCFFMYVLCRGNSRPIRSLHVPDFLIPLDSSTSSANLDSFLNTPFCSDGSRRS